MISPRRKHNEDENVKKQMLIDMLAKEPIEVSQLAYIYAKNYYKYGVNVVNDWETAIRQSAALESAYHRGWSDCLERIDDHSLT